MRKILLILLLFPFISYAANFEPQASYQVCFTPGENCTQEIVSAINDAVTSIKIQAYSFTSRPITRALTMAKERGVKVEVILDKSAISNNNSNQSTAWYFLRHGIPVWIDKKPAIAHNKVMVIDQTQVITGSFNFTRAAQERNAENLLIIDDAGLAKKYLKNWQRRRVGSEPLAISAAPAPSSQNWFAEFLEMLLHWLKSLFK